MGKKDKLNKNVKEKEVVKRKKEVVGTQKEKRSLNLWWKFVLVTATLKVALSGIVIYKLFFQVPELPKVDLQEYWGPEGVESKDVSIRPYRIVFGDAMQEEMRTRFEFYRRAEQEKRTTSFETAAWNYGVNPETFGEFIAEWIFDYKFRERPKFLNQFDHFKTNIQGLDIHFIRVKPKLDGNQKVKVLPLLLLHGWPGSVREFYEAIPKLTTPRKGYDFVFEVIAPSLPGFIYSDAPTRPGMSAIHVAVIMRNLMRRVGHTRFYVQGGDYGHIIGSNMATLFPDELLGFHTNMAVNFSKLATLTWLLGGLWPSLIESRVPERMYPVSERLKFYMEEFGYFHLQATKPDTIGAVLQDSPVGLAAYILDRFMVGTNLDNKNATLGGLNEYYSSEKLLDNIMLYWASNSITTAMRHYKENCHNPDELALREIPTTVPTWALRLRHEIFYQPDFILRWKYTNFIGGFISDVGGHFAAFERPKMFSDDVFRAVDYFIQFKALGGGIPK